MSLFEAMDVRHSDVTRTGAVTVLHALHYTRSANKTHTHTHTYTHTYTHKHIDFTGNRKTLVGFKTVRDI